LQKMFFWGLTIKGSKTIIQLLLGFGIGENRNIKEREVINMNSIVVKLMNVRSEYGFAKCAKKTCGVTSSYRR